MNGTKHTITSSARESIETYLDGSEGYQQRAATILEVLTEDAYTRFESTGAPELLNAVHVLTVAARQLEALGGEPDRDPRGDRLQDPEEIAAACRANPAEAETLLQVHFGRGIAALLQQLTGAEPGWDSTRSVICAVRTALIQGRPGAILALIRNELIQFVLHFHAAEAIGRAITALPAAERAALIASCVYRANEAAIAEQTNLTVEEQIALHRRFRQACAGRGAGNP